MTTDKQIIIDGCNVSGCEFRFRTYGCDCMSSNRETKVLTESSRCADNPNCYYKQLKRKEQECEKLKAEVKSKTEYIQEQREIIDQYSKEIEMYKKCQGKRASKREEELKAENKELKEELEELKEENEYNEANAIEFKQTLTEIKEIAKPYQRDIDKICGYCEKYDNCHACCIDDLKFYEYRTGTTKACEKFVELERFKINIAANKILQKISEVLE